jgi:hypothetical protein
MSEMDSTINRLLPLLYANLATDTCVDNVIPEPESEPAGLFDRMMRQAEGEFDEYEDDEDDEDDIVGARTISFDEDDNLQVTIVGDYGAMTFSEPINDINYMCGVSGGELLSRISELSMELHHDELYTGDYVRLYEVLTNLVTNL